MVNAESGTNQSPDESEHKAHRQHFDEKVRFQSVSQEVPKGYIRLELSVKLKPVDGFREGVQQEHSKQESANNVQVKTSFIVIHFITLPLRLSACTLTVVGH